MSGYDMTYLGVAVIVALCGLLALGLSNNPDAEMAGPILFCAAFWPLVLGCLVAYGVISSPYWAGRYIRKRRTRLEADYREVQKMIGVDE